MPQASSLKPIVTLVPGHQLIELVAYYPEFADYYPECELQTKRWFVDHAERDWVIFDAGANIGYYSVLFSRLAPDGHVYAFEPTETIEMLRVNLEHSGCTNVTPLQFALGYVPGRRAENIFRIWGRDPERRTYEFTTVDQAFQELGLARLDCIKIDVDSFDFDVLRGAEQILRRFNPWIVVELNNGLWERNHSICEVLEWMYARGYRGAHVLDEENYAFRRETQAGSGGSDHPSIVLTFENRPLVLASSFARGEAIERPFLETAIPSNAADVGVEADGTVRATVPGPRWSYAASWEATSRLLSEREVSIEIEVAVDGAAIGLGCVADDNSSYVGDEAIAAPVFGYQTVALIVRHAPSIARLILRNADEKGVDGVARVRAIRAYRAYAPTAPRDQGALASAKKRLSFSECAAALQGIEPATLSAPQSEPGIDIVDVDRLKSELGFVDAFQPEIRIYRNGLAGFNPEVDEAALFVYLYQGARPTTHLEISDNEGYATRPAAELGGRITAIPHGGVAAGSFDSVFIDGQTVPETIAADTYEALRCARAGALIMWHGFCPDVTSIAQNPAVRSMVAAFVRNHAFWRSGLTKWFWIRPSWLVIGIKS